MSIVIDLLEKMGQDAALRSMNSDAVASALSRAEISSEIAEALSTGNQALLTELLGARANVSCMVFPAKQDDDEKDPEDDKDVPDDDKEKGMRQSFDLVAIAS